ncbi:hypothetical protein [Clostridium sp. Marseille-Q7071]
MSVYRDMEVVKVKTEDGKERYFVADDDGLPILKFIRFKDNTMLVIVDNLKL